MQDTTSHEWIKENRVGITADALQQLGEIVYIEFPQVGDNIETGQEVAVLESTKAAVDVYCPASGTIVAINEELQHNIDLINQDPEGAGWIFEIKTV